MYILCTPFKDLLLHLKTTQNVVLSLLNLNNSLNTAISPPHPDQKLFNKLVNDYVNTCLEKGSEIPPYQELFND